MTRRWRSRGRSLLTGLPIKVNVSTSDLYEPVMMLSEQIGTAAHQVLEKTPPELAGDIFRNGVVLTGGGAQLHGLPEYLSQELKVDVTVSPDPVNCVALGTAMSLGLNDKLETGFLDATPPHGPPLTGALTRLVKKLEKLQQNFVHTC